MGYNSKHSNIFLRDGIKNTPAKMHEGGKAHASDLPTYGYSESGEFIQTGGKPRNRFLAPLSNYNAKERAELIKTGKIAPDPSQQPTGEGSDTYLLGGNVQMKNLIESSNQKL